MLRKRPAAKTLVESAQLRVEMVLIEYTVVRSARRKKTMQLRVERDGAVRVLAPMRATPGEIERMVRRRAEWTGRVAAADTPVRREFVTGAVTPFLGRDLSMIVSAYDGASVRIRLRREHLYVEVPVELGDGERHQAIKVAIVCWYRRQAVDRVSVAAARWSPIVGREPSNVIVRDQRRRWGSCSVTDVLRFNWRLVMLDPSLLDYVVVHELTHLIQRNHSPAFWSEVARVLPDWKERRVALRTAGRAIEGW